MNSPQSLININGAVQYNQYIDVPAKETRVALVSMPWGSVHRPSLAIALLKQCVVSAGFEADIHLLNMRFAERLGVPQYEEISDSAVAHSEWYFAQLLFGSQGLGEIQNDWSDMQDNPAAADLIRTLKGSVGNSGEACTKIAHEDVPWFIADCMAQVDWSRYMAVGFTTTFAQSLASLLLANRIKQAFPQVKIVFGGANVDGEMGVEFMRGFPWIDYVVHGEAENSFPQLLKDIAAGDNRGRIPGVSIRRDGHVLAGHADAQPIVDLNDSPMPDYSDYVDAVEKIGLKKKLGLRFYFESSRGCWWGAKHHCTFCGLNGTTMAYRAKTAQRTYSEIMQLAKDYRCLYLSATDNILAMEYFTHLLPKLAEQDIDLRIFYEVKANLTIAQLKVLRDAGVREIQPGIESFNTRILQLMRKGITAIQNIQLLKWCYEFEIAPAWNLLYGFPGEDAADYENLPNIFRLLMHLKPATNMSRVVFERFSPYSFDSDKFGLKLTPWQVYQFIFPSGRVNLDEVAYYFDGEWDRKGQDPDGYIKPAVDVWRDWVSHWKDRKVVCYYDKGPGYVIIHDSRPRTIGGDLSPRKLYLSGPIAETYLFCGETRSFKAIRQMLTERFPGDSGENDIRLSLESLVSEGLMFQEENRYLSLAVRRKPEVVAIKR